MRAIQGRNQWLLLLAIVAAGLLATVAGLWCFRWPMSRITFEVYNQIELGMTESEINAVIGAAGSDYWKPATSYFSDLARESEISSGRCYGRTWYGRECTIDVMFEKSTGKSCGMCWEGGARATPVERRFKAWKTWGLGKVGISVPESEFDF